MAAPAAGTPGRDKRIWSLPDFGDSSGNVFADLGFPDAEEELVRARLILALHTILKDRGLTQSEAARLLGTTQPQVSALMCCRAGTSSIKRG